MADASKKILKCNLKKQDGEGVSWIDLNQDRYKCRAIMNTVITPRPTFGRGKGRGGVLNKPISSSCLSTLPRHQQQQYQVLLSTCRSTSECHRVSSRLFGSPPSLFPNTGSSKYDGTQLTLHSRVNRRPVTPGTVVWVCVSDTRGQEKASDVARIIVIADLKT